MKCYQTRKEFRDTHPRKVSGKRSEDRRMLEDTIKIDVFILREEAMIWIISIVTQSV
jgi:hypothetical protein